jgi:peptidoglycan hydrolase FlgJ
MLRVESSSLGAGGAFDGAGWSPGRPTGNGAGFASMYRSLSADIRNTVENGFAAATSSTLAAPALPSQWNDGAHAWLAAYLASDRSASANKSAIAPVYVGEEQRVAFLEDIAPWAQRAAEQLGTSPHIVAAHAALESNWGVQPVKAEGRNAYNLFGIKAGKNWGGRAVNSMTTEHIDGQVVRLSQRFRAYSGYDGAFRDYARLLMDNPRYAAALNAGDDARAFSRGLKQGGYATDVHYEDKLVKVAKQIERMGRNGS